MPVVGIVPKPAASYGGQSESSEHAAPLDSSAAEASRNITNSPLSTLSVSGPVLGLGDRVHSNRSVVKRESRHCIRTRARSRLISPHRPTYTPLLACRHTFDGPSGGENPEAKALVKRHALTVQLHSQSKIVRNAAKQGQLGLRIPRHRIEKPVKKGHTRWGGITKQVTRSIMHHSEALKDDGVASFTTRNGGEAVKNVDAI
jgi:hypothetical protein